MAEKVDDHLQPVPQDIMGSVTRTDPETLKQYEEIGRITQPYLHSPNARAKPFAIKVFCIDKWVPMGISVSFSLCAVWALLHCIHEDLF